MRKSLIILCAMLLSVPVHAQNVRITDTAGHFIAVNADGSMPVATLNGTKVLYDAFEASFDTTNIWNAATSAGGGVGEAWSSGAITLGTGTTANGYSYVQTQASFQPVPPAYNVFEDAIQVPASIPTNAEAFWGFGTSPASPTAAIPITEGCGFEIQTGGKMFAVCFAGSVRNNIQDLSASTGNSKQPIDGKTHVYFLYFRGDRYWFAIDDVNNIVASQYNGVNGPNINTQPLKIAATAGTSNPSSSLTVTVASVWVGDLGQNASQIADGTYPWRRAKVNADGTLNTITAPTSATTAGITAVTSSSAEATHIIKGAPGNFYSVYATNSTATAGFILVFNATSAPADGAVIPLDCVPIAASSTSGINYAPGPPKIYGTGIVVVLSSGANCYTKTTGTITGFISASAS